MNRCCTQTEWAESHGITPRQVHNLIDRGLPTRIVKGKKVVPVVEANRWFVRFKQDEALDRQPTPPDGADALVRKLAADAELAELKVAKAKGELATLDYMEQQLGAILQRLRAQLLAAPGKHAPQGVGLRSIAESQQHLERMVAELMAALSETGEDPELDAADGGPAADAEGNDDAPAGTPGVVPAPGRPGARRTRAPAKAHRRRVG